MRFPPTDPRRHRPTPAMSLLVTVALATLGASCKSKSGSGDAAGPAPGATDVGVDLPGADVPGRVVVQPDSAADTRIADAPGRDLADIDLPPAVPEAGSPDDASSLNPHRLWLSGPEDDIHLADVEPATPF
jgi:hypothetical protein